MNQFLIGLSVFLSCNMMIPEIIDPRTYSGDRFGLVDSTQREIIPANYSEINYIGHGLFDCEGIDANDRFCKNDKHYIFNRDGKELTPPLSEGVWYWHILWLGEKSETKTEDDLMSLPDDSVLVIRKDQKIGLCDPRGNIIAEPIYSAVSEGAEGFALLYFYDNDKKMKRDREKTFLVDLRTHKITQLEFNLGNIWTNRFSDGLAKVEASSGLYGYIDRQGKFQIPPRFYDGGDFANGLACVVQSFGTSLIDKRGKVVSPKTLDIEGFRGDYAVAGMRTKSDSLRGLVNHKYEFVLPLSYKWIHPLAPVNKTLGPHDSDAETPKIYVATINDSRKVALGADGKPLFDFPIVQSIDGLEYDLIRCNGAKKFPEWTSLKSKPKTMYLTLQGERTIPVQASGEIAHERLLKRISGDDGNFDSKYWKTERHIPISRQRMFENFVSQHALIGMKRKEVTKLLGEINPQRFVSWKEPPHLEYWIYRSNSCTEHSSSIVKIFYDKMDVVTGWRYAIYTSNGTHEEPLVTSNKMSDD